jgi:hypothetical protein
MHQSNVNDMGPDPTFRDYAHPLHVGDVVAVFALDHAMQPFFEGQATIIVCCTQPHTYRVRFQD